MNDRREIAEAAIARALELVEPWETSDVMQEVRAALRVQE